MTCALTTPQDAAPAPATPHPLLPLIRLLARDAARKDFANRRECHNGESSND